MNRFISRVMMLLVCIGGAALLARAAGDDSAKPAPAEEKTSSAPKNAAAKLLPLNKQGTVQLDREGKRLLLNAEVVFREGLLEMLCCLKQTKEHESILAIDCKAQEIHAGLLLLGANPGTPVRFDPELQPPTGQKIDIFLAWTDEKGKLHRVPAQQWIRHAIHRFFVATLETLPAGLVIPKESELRYDVKNKELTWYGPMTADQRDALLKLSGDKEYRKAINGFHEQSQSRPMKADWVFAGSGFLVDEQTGEKFYQAEGGDLICVANMPAATIDVAIESSATGEQNLLFEAWAERIPPLETKVTIELVPVFEEK